MEVQVVGMGEGQVKCIAIGTVSNDWENANFIKTNLHDRRKI